MMLSWACVDNSAIFAITPSPRVPGTLVWHGAL
jgi:hypothetical protein